MSPNGGHVHYGQTITVNGDVYDRSVYSALGPERLHAPARKRGHRRRRRDTGFRRPVLRGGELIPLRDPVLAAALGQVRQPARPVHARQLRVFLWVPTGARRRSRRHDNDPWGLAGIAVEGRPAGDPHRDGQPTDTIDTGHGAVLPAGNVQFFDVGALLGTGVIGGGGLATFTTARPAAALTRYARCSRTALTTRSACRTARTTWWRREIARASCRRLTRACTASSSR